MNADERTVIDLSDLALDRCEAAMKGILQLLDSSQQKMIVSTNVAALMFGFVACFLQDHYEKKDGKKMPFDTAVDAAIHYVAKLAKENPRPDTSLPRDTQENERG